MLKNILPGSLIGIIALLLHTLNTIFWFIPIFLFALLKGLFQIPMVTRSCNTLLNFFASSWICVNDWIHCLTKSIRWRIDIPTNLSTRNWYLVIANHQSWVDIMALQKAFNHQIPFLKFFLKQQLFWVPVLGLAWWALDFPFMRRYNKSYLKKHPEKRGKDFETTRKACEKFKTIPISIMNFVEGTRFTEQKKRAQNSPYQHLLKPKSGGIGYVLTLMGGEIHHLLDVTICYPQNKDVSFWDFLCGRVPEIHLSARLLDIPDAMKGDYINDSNTRKIVQHWIKDIWLVKDQKLETINRLEK